MKSGMHNSAKLALVIFFITSYIGLQEISHMAEEQEWANLLGEIFEKLTQKHASITYDFENLEMKGQVEKESKIVPTGSVSLTGKLTITAQ